MELTASNYYSLEANREYMSVSQFKDFRQCEAAAMAKVRGEYAQTTTTAMLVGSYVDAFFEGTLPQFLEAHPEIRKRDGTLKADFVQAEEITKRLSSDRLFSLLMSGRKQVIRTGTIGRVPFKIKMDSLLDAATVSEIVKDFPETAQVFGFGDGAIVDLKVMRSMEQVWSEEDGAKVPFARAWGYDIQGAVYQAIEGHDLPFILAVGTKEDPCDIAALHIPDNDLRDCLAEVEELAPRYQSIKQGELEPSECGHCPWCRMKRQLTGIMDYRSGWEVCARTNQSPVRPGTI